MFLEFLVENKVFHFSKKAQRVGTARNKWLKKALSSMIFCARLNKFEQMIFLKAICSMIGMVRRLYRLYDCAENSFVPSRGTKRGSIIIPEKIRKPEIF